MTPIWRCRLVCKKWNVAIENSFRNEDAGHYLNDSGFYTVGNSKLVELGTCSFSSEFQVETFLQQFKTTHYDGGRRVALKCPFLGRSVEVLTSWYNGDMELHSLINSLIELLEKFGDQVWYFQFRTRFQCRLSKSEREVVNEDPVYYYKIVRRMVELMPHLKVVRIQIGIVKQPSTVLLQRLNDKLERNRFPVGANLEIMKAGQIPGCIVLSTKRKKSIDWK